MFINLVQNHNVEQNVHNLEKNVRNLEQNFL